MFKKTIGLLLAVTIMACKGSKEAIATAPKPVNILWLYGEDISPWMPLWGDNTVETPNIDFLASKGVVFKNCFSISPVCSPTRSGMITGVMPTTIGAHNHRSGRTPEVSIKLPDGMLTLPQLFKKQGFHTYNEGKDDFNWQYNWDDYWTGPHEQKRFFGKQGHGSWNDRKAGQAFFGVIELFGGKSKLKAKVPVDPATIKVPPYYPDTPFQRQELANHYNQIKVTDVEVGQIIEQLKDDGLYKNTIIIFMSDNGYKTMRDKQFLYDGGTHMPLVIASPGNPKLLNQFGVREDMVSLMDITATSLSLAGIPIPSYMESKDIFAKDFKRDYVVSVRDRCDFTIDRIRSIRTKEFKYIKNFMTDRPLMQSQYRDIRKSYKMLMKTYKEGKVSFYSKWLEDERPAEELYDLANDPHEINNLAKDPNFNTKLVELRGYLNDWIAETGDKGQYPESKEQLKIIYERWGERCVNKEFDAVR